MEFPGIHKHCGSVREDIECALSSSGIDGVDVQISFLPYRQTVSYLYIMRLAAGTQQSQQQPKSGSENDITPPEHNFHLIPDG